MAAINMRFRISREFLHASQKALKKGSKQMILHAARARFWCDSAAT